MKLVLRAMLALVVAAGLWVLTLALIGALYRPNTRIPAGLAGEHLDVQMLPIRVLQRGSGPDVLLIHGSPGSIEDWIPLFGALSDGLRVTAYDRPGHGYSGDGGDHSRRGNARLAQSLIERMHLHDVIVVGHSFGGAVALALALRNPTQVRGYVLLDASVYQPTRPPARLYELLALPLVGLGGASLLSPLLATQTIRRGLLHAFRPNKPPDDFVALRTRIWSTPKVAHATATEALSAKAELATLSPHYAQIARPLVILAQRADGAHQQSAERLARQVPHAQLQLLSGTGHYLQIDKTRDVAQAIRALAASPQQP